MQSIIIKKMLCFSYNPDWSSEKSTSHRTETVGVYLTNSVWSAMKYGAKSWEAQKTNRPVGEYIYMGQDLYFFSFILLLLFFSIVSKWYEAFS